MQEDSVFTKIIKGEIPAYNVYEDDRVLAFLDVHPVQPGHTLVVPKKQIEKIEDLDEETYAHLWSTVKKLMLHYRAKLPGKRIALKVEGFHVPHVHVHIIPCHEGKDFWVQRSQDDPIDHDALKAMRNQLTLVK
jgi:histidine triad (HIT) family protein